MDIERRDELLGSPPASPARRSLFAVLTGGLLFALPLALGTEEAAAKKKRKKHKEKGKKQSTTPQTPSTPQTPATPVTKADAACYGPVDGSAYVDNGDSRLAQTFTALASGPLVSAELPIHKLAGSGGAYILRLSPVDGAGAPTNTVLASASIPNLSVPDGNTTLTFMFADPAVVVAGTQYALVLTRPGSNHLVWQEDLDGTCLGRMYFSDSQASQFVAAGNGDLYFRTFVTS
jgi:hypothetical protein